MSKKYDVVAVTGTYTDQQGQQKNRFENVGAVIVNKSGGFTLLLKKTFNPAGLADPARETIALNLYEPQQQGRQPVQQSAQQAPADDFESDDIPF